MRGRVFTTLDLFETQAVIYALDAQIKVLEFQASRIGKAERLEYSYMVARQRALRDRLNKRFVPAFKKLTDAAQSEKEAAGAR